MSVRQPEPPKLNSGDRNGRLVIVNIYRKPGRWVYECVCDCGETVHVMAHNFKTGKTVSCGCKRREDLGLHKPKHGYARSKVYRAWVGMKSRCYDKNFCGFHNYGGRGIRVCDRWLNDFSAFLEDMGEPSKRESLDRIDVNGNYEPKNCRWASQTTQSNNRRTNRAISAFGKTMTEAQWCKRLGLTRGTISHRIKAGWTVDDAVSKPNQR